ncbi:MAG: transporter [Prevotella sp.]|nr:transporter [Prevotella sp.]
MEKFVRFLKNWSLPVGMGTGIITYLVFALTPSLDGAAHFFAPFFDRIVPLFMFFILFVTFCKVDFHRMRPVAWHLWEAIFQIIFIGVIMSVILAYKLQGANLVLMEALLVCVISPCAAAAPVVTNKLGGDLEQMTTYTFLTNFITALFIPLCFPMIEKAGHITFWAAFLTILKGVVTVLVVPMLLAYIVKHYMKRLHQRIVSVKDLGYYLWATSLSIVTGVTMKNIFNAKASGWLLLAIALLGLVLCIIQFAVGRWIGHFSGHTAEGGQALGQKNTAFAIWIAYTYLTPLSSVGPGCYILWQNIINSIEIWQHRRDENRQLAATQK